MQAQLQWWVTSLLIPGFFLILGAAVTFLFGQVKDWSQARRDKRAFLTSIGKELKITKTKLEDAGKFADELLLRLQATGHAPQLIPHWGTAVFDAQLGKLGTVFDDDLIEDTIQAYSLIARIDRMVAFVNENSREYASTRAGNERAEAQTRLQSSIMVIREEIASAVPTIQALIQKLPQR